MSAAKSQIQDAITRMGLLLVLASPPTTTAQFYGSRPGLAGGEGTDPGRHHPYKAAGRPCVTYPVTMRSCPLSVLDPLRQAMRKHGKPKAVVNHRGELNAAVSPILKHPPLKTHYEQILTKEEPLSNEYNFSSHLMRSGRIAWGRADDLGGRGVPTFEFIAMFPFFGGNA